MEYMLMVHRTNKFHGIPNVKRILFQSSKKTYLTWAWCKSGTRAPASGTQDTPQSLKVGPLTLLRFKSGTFRPPPPSSQCSKMGPQDALQSLKVGPPSGTSPFFNEFFFLQNILSFFRICLFFLPFQITNIILDLAWFHRPFQVSYMQAEGNDLCEKITERQEQKVKQDSVFLLSCS